MNIYTVTKIGNGNFSAVSDNSCQQADNMSVCDSRFLMTSVVTANNVIIFPDFQNPMQDILTAVTLIKRYIVFFQSAVVFLNYKNVPALFNQWHHTVADVGVNYFAVLFKFGAKITPRLLRYFLIFL